MQDHRMCAEAWIADLILATGTFAVLQLLFTSPALPLILSFSTKQTRPGARKFHGFKWMGVWASGFTLEDWYSVIVSCFYHHIYENCPNCYVLVCKSVWAMANLPLSVFARIAGPRPLVWEMFSVYQGLLYLYMQSLVEGIDWNAIVCNCS